MRRSARLEKTGDHAVEFSVAYLLERTGDAWRVLGYVSERDQLEEMKAAGLP